MNMKGYKRLLVVPMLFTLVACGEDAAQPKKEDTVNQSVADHKKTPAPTFMTDPSKVKELQARFTVEQPKRVITTSVSIAEMLHILDVKPVGVPTSMHALPEGFEKIDTIGSAIEPDLEKIASLTPDLVLGPESIEESLTKKFKPLGIDSTFLPTDSLDELKVSLETLGQVFGEQERATAFLERLNAKEAMISDQKDGSSPTVLLLFGSAEAFMVMNENTYAGSLAQKVGATNVLTKMGGSKEAYVPLNMEAAIAANPDAILLVAHGDETAALKQLEGELTKTSAWKQVTALKEGRVATLPYDTFGVSSITKAEQALEELSSLLTATP